MFGYFVPNSPRLKKRAEGIASKLMLYLEKNASVTNCILDNWELAQDLLNLFKLECTRVDWYQ